VIPADCSNGETAGLLEVERLDISSAIDFVHMRQFRVGGSDGRAASLFSDPKSVLVCDAASGIEAEGIGGAADHFNAC